MGRKPDKIPKVVIASGTPPREMKILDDKCNVIAPEGHVVKTDGNETINALICCGCHQVEASWAHDEKSGFRSGV
jgi:hypothetical protein